MLVHHLLVVNARVKNPPKDPAYIIEWKKNLIEAIGMKILDGPRAIYHDMPGNRGLTAFSLIETSHIALHLWDEDSPSLLRLDVYSCAEFEISKILEFIEEFEPVLVDYKFLDRTGDFILSPIEDS